MKRPWRDYIERTCKICGKPMTEGYCIDDDYYCSDSCLHIDFTEDEYLTAYEEGWAYWTEWED